MNKIQVIYNGWGERWPLGTLAMDGAAPKFEYSPEALASKLELSPYRVPLRSGLYQRGEVFFEGLSGFIADALPDGWGRMLITDIRVPVHTLAGLLHSDYRIPSIDAVEYLRFTKLITMDMREVNAVFDRSLFNLIFNNRDDHGKNFSYRLEKDGQWRLSPAYDLTFNQGPRGDHQMAYAGETLAPSLANVLGVAEKGEVSEAAARNSIKRMVAVAGHLSKCAVDLPIRKTSLRTLVKAIAENCARLRP
ncbi:MAG: HipA domain-containing protein [Burkholderiales bacterium]